MPPFPLGAASIHTPLECLTGPGLPTVGAVQPVLLFATPQRNAAPGPTGLLVFFGIQDLTMPPLSSQAVRQEGSTTGIQLQSLCLCLRVHEVALSKALRDTDCSFVCDDRPNLVVGLLVGKIVPKDQRGRGDRCSHTQSVRRHTCISQATADCLCTDPKRQNASGPPRRTSDSPPLACCE